MPTIRQKEIIGKIEAFLEQNNADITDLYLDGFINLDFLEDLENNSEVAKHLEAIKDIAFTYNQILANEGAQKSPQFQERLNEISKDFDKKMASHPLLMAAILQAPLIANAKQIGAKQSLDGALTQSEAQSSSSQNEAAAQSVFGDVVDTISSAAKAVDSFLTFPPLAAAESDSKTAPTKSKVKKDPLFEQYIQKILEKTIVAFDEEALLPANRERSEKLQKNLMDDFENAIRNLAAEGPYTKALIEYNAQTLRKIMIIHPLCNKYFFDRIHQMSAGAGYSSGTNMILMLGVGKGLISDPSYLLHELTHSYEHKLSIEYDKAELESCYKKLSLLPDLAARCLEDSSLPEYKEMVKLAKYYESRPIIITRSNDENYSKKKPSTATFEKFHPGAPSLTEHYFNLKLTPNDGATKFFAELESLTNIKTRKIVPVSKEQKLLAKMAATLAHLMSQKQTEEVYQSYVANGLIQGISLEETVLKEHHANIVERAPEGVTGKICKEEGGAFFAQKNRQPKETEPKQKDVESKPKTKIKEVNSSKISQKKPSKHAEL